MTSAPAARAGLRSGIAPGARADIVVLDDERFDSTATFGHPASPSVGIDHVFVNGVAVLREGGRRRRDPDDSSEGDRMSESKTVGVGIVGVGGIAVSHMAALRATDVARLVAVTDLDRARAGEVARQEGVIAAADVAALLADPAVEAVIVCTPNLTHEQLGRQVLAAGRHLLMEKPLAMTGEGARALARRRHPAACSSRSATATASATRASPSARPSTRERSARRASCASR
ncbi:Gfo/Idh/MocA family protein [Pseudolysinimonas kribbensis]|nr:Gfo/Idh/MocA family oxidoreductase [Pseudolysinimonas kribbensis]